MKKLALGITGLIIAIGFSGCATSKMQIEDILDRSNISEKYKKSKKNKAIACTKDFNNGMAHCGYCIKTPTEQIATECAIKRCKKAEINASSNIKDSSCKIYDLNDKVIWK